MIPKICHCGYISKAVSSEKNQENCKRDTYRILSVKYTVIVYIVWDTDTNR